MLAIAVARRGSEPRDWSVERSPSPTRPGHRDLACTFRGERPTLAGMRETFLMTVHDPLARPAENDATAARVIDFLRSEGAADLGHGGARTLLAHLVGCYEIVRRWEQATVIAHAALIHSVTAPTFTRGHSCRRRGGANWSVWSGSQPSASPIYSR